MLHIKPVNANWRALLSGCAVLLVAAYPVAGAEQLDSVRSLNGSTTDHLLRVQHNPAQTRRTFQGQPEYPPSGYLEEFETEPAPRWPEDRPEFRSERARDMAQDFIPQQHPRETPRADESGRFLEWGRTGAGADSRPDITPPPFGERSTLSERFPEPRDPRSLTAGQEHSPYWSRQPAVEEARREPSWPTPPPLPSTSAHWSHPPSRAEVHTPSPPPTWGSRSASSDSSAWPSAATMDPRSGSANTQWPSYSGSQQWPSASEFPRAAPQWRESPEQASAPRRGAGYEPPPRFATTPYDQGGAAFPPPQWPAPTHSSQGMPAQAEHSSGWPPQRPPRWGQDSYQSDPGAMHYPDPRDQRLRSPDWHR